MRALSLVSPVLLRPSGGLLDGLFGSNESNLVQPDGSVTPERLVILAEHRDATRQGAMNMTAQALTAGFRAVPAHANGAWVGPMPRVTRVSVDAAGGILGQNSQYVTRTAWVWEWPGRTAYSLVAQQVRQEVAARMVALIQHDTTDEDEVRAVRESWTVTAMPYAEATNGPLSWWQSGEAAASSNTTNAFNLPANTADNPIGPTRPLPSNTPGFLGLPGNLGNPAELGATIAKGILYAGGAGLFIYGGFKLVGYLGRSRREEHRHYAEPEVESDHP